MKRGKRTFWIVGENSQTHRDHATALNHSGFDVSFLSSLTDCLNQLKTNRPHVIMVDDSGGDGAVLNTINVLASLPEVQGARMILTVSVHNQKASQCALDCNFRDIIPIDLKSQEWLERMQYATASTPQSFKTPNLQISTNQIATLELPARLVAVQDEKLVFETRGRHTPGSHIIFHGPMCDWLGMPHISCEVIASARKRLVYRYSRSFLAKPTIPDEFQLKYRLLLKQFAETNSGLRLRIFFAIQDSNLRSALLSIADQQKFECNVALQKSQLPAEIQYFSPDLIFLDEGVIGQLSKLELQKIHESLADSAKLVVFGKMAAAEQLRNFHPKHAVYHELNGIPSNLNIRLRYSVKRAANYFDLAEGTLFLPPESPFSIGHFSFPARISRIHPRVGEISLGFEVDNFALCRLDAPFLRKTVGQNPVIKITSSDEVSPTFNGSPFHVRSQFYFAALGKMETSNLAKQLSHYVMESYRQFISGPHAVERPVIEATPEKKVVAQAPVVVSPAPETTRPYLKIPPKPTAQKYEVVPAQSKKPVDLRETLHKRYANAKAYKAKSAPIALVIVTFLAFAVSSGFIVWLASTAGEKYWSKSGSDYSDQLKKFRQSPAKSDSSEEP